VDGDGLDQPPPSTLSGCSVTILNQNAQLDSPDLLLQLPKQFRMKKLLNADTQTVAEFLDRGDRRAVVPAADDVVDGGLGHAAHGA